jgi:serine/threonine-protein kinase
MSNGPNKSIDRDRPWRSKWIEVDDGHVGKGGQGIVRLVRARDDPDALFALKLLKQNNVRERRGRMHHEVAALRWLNELQCPGVPRCVDANTEAFADSDCVPLYLVEEYVGGGTLADRVAHAPLDTNEAMGMLEALLDTLAVCHGHGIVHRDIKPDNVVLRGGDPARPVLIDFGLSFNAEDLAPAHETATGEQLTNRFLALPELASSESDKRSPVSDLTLVIGLVMFSLTGIVPATLLDERRRAPHQREQASAMLAAMSPAQAALFGELFGRAFEHAMTQRWQSVAEISGVLQRYRAKLTSSSTGTFSSTLAELRDRGNANTARSDRENIESYFRSMKGLCERVFAGAARQLGRGYGVQHSQGPIEWHRFAMIFDLGISRSTMDIATKAALWCRFEVEATSTEVVLKGRIQQESTMEELFRTGLHSEFAGEAVTEVVERLLQRLLVTVAEDHDI